MTHIYSNFLFSVPKAGEGKKSVFAFDLIPM
ncbi:hypothetical protein H8957_016263, partial [Semnopithecus entellus]